MSSPVSRNVEVEAADRHGGIRPPARADRIVVTRGGSPPDEVLAAVVVTLSVHAAHDAAAALTSEPADVAPAWLRAALVEGTGGPAVVAPGDLDVAG